MKHGVYSYCLTNWIRFGMVNHEGRSLFVRGQACLKGKGHHSYVTALDASLCKT